MSKPIYNLYLVRRPTERYLQLTQAERDALSAQDGERLAKAGGKSVIACNASWWNEAYRAWGVEMFPDFESWRKYADMREKADWYSYADSWSILGTWHDAIKQEDAATPEPGKIYQLFLYRHDTEAQEQLTQAERDALWAREGTERQDSRFVVGANCYWSTEEYRAFGVIMHPDIDAVQRHFAHLEEIHWPRYTQARTLLGTLWGE
jgi:hypothetical protein